MEFFKKLIEALVAYFKKAEPTAPIVSPKAEVQAPVAGGVTDKRRYIRVIKTDSKQANGLYNLSYELREGDTLIDSVMGVSGQGYAQRFRYASQGVAGSMEPIPEGYYTLGMPEWANGKNNYSASWGAGLGPMWVAITPAQKMARGDFGIHLDENVKTSPGSAGCVTVQSVDLLKKVVSWFSNPQSAPKLLVVNWNLGSVETKGMGYKSYGAKFDPDNKPTIPAPKPNPVEGDLNGLQVAIDVGHGMYGEEGGGDIDSGAVANGYEEHNLNRIQAFEIEKLLEARGAVVNVYCYEKGMTNERLTLGHKGEKGGRHHIFISLHHNAFNKSAQYTICMLADESDGRKRHTAQDAVFAQTLAASINKVLGFGLAGDKGLVRRSLGLFYNRMTTWPECKAACLVESYFIDDAKLKGQDLNALSLKAAGGIAEGIASYAKSAKLV